MREVIVMVALALLVLALALFTEWVESSTGNDECRDKRREARRR